MSGTAFYINAAFTILMVSLAILDHRGYGTDKHKDFKSAILSMGILGTFFGIFWGLQDFDTKNIQDSIPHLLDGLKIAFFTSIVGMGLAIFLMVMQRLMAKRSESDRSIDFLVHQVSKLDMLENLENLNKLDTLKHLIVLESLQRDQNGKFELMISNQTKLFADMNGILEASFKQTNQALEKAIDQLARGASTEIIKALEIVIKDFNNSLSEQFGQNFKELNRSVEKLHAWQENYASYIEKTEKSLDSALKAIESSSSTFDNMAQKSLQMMDSYERLGVLLDTSNRQIELLNSGLNTYLELGNRAKESFALMESGFDRMDKRYEVTIEHIESMLDESKKYNQQLGEQVRATMDSSKDGFLAFATESVAAIKNMQTELRDEIARSVHELKESNEKIILDFKDTLIKEQEHAFVLLEQNSKRFEGNLNSSFSLIENKITESQRVLGGYFNEIDSSIKNSFTSLISSVLSSNELLNQDIKTLFSDMNTHAKESITEATKGMKDSFEIVGRELMDSNKEMSDIIKSNVLGIKDVGEAIAESFTASSQKIEQLTLKSSEVIGGAFDEFKLKTIEQQALIKESHVRSIKQLAALYESTNTEMSNAIKSSMSSFEDGIAKSRASIDENSLAIISTIKARLERGGSEFEAYARGMTEKYLAFLQELNEKSQMLPKELAGSFEESFQKLSKELRDYALNTHNSVKDAKNMIESVTKETKEVLEGSLIKTNELNRQLTGSLRGLDIALSGLTQQFKSDYEWFLRRIRELMGSQNR